MNEEKIASTPQEQGHFLGLCSDVAFPLFYTISLTIVMAVVSSFMN